jgi:hypothetical protein
VLLNQTDEIGQQAKVDLHGANPPIPSLLVRRNGRRCAFSVHQNLEPTSPSASSVALGDAMASRIQGFFNES